MDELLEQFLIEGRELVAQAGKDVAALARDPGDAGAIDSGFRALHTLKGSFAIFALTPAERLLHGAEDLFEQLRRGTIRLQPAMISALVACLDQTDRWIDAMERDGALPEEAPAQADTVLALLQSGPERPAAPLPVARPPEPQTDWLAELIRREETLIASDEAALTAFRYRPDADCFFRGEDPLAVIEALPDLVALTVLPAHGAWPAVADLEPFSCHCIIEGLSQAGEAELRAAFRLQPDQVDFAPIARRAPKPGTAEQTRETAWLRVDAARIDALAEGLSDLAVAANALAPLAEEIAASDRAMAARLRAAQADIERVAAGLHRHLAQVRLVPLEPSLRRLPRAAREIAAGLGKEVAFVMEGETIEADKQIAEGLFEPLLHLLRNAIDHGIETPAQRRSAGKPVAGQMRLSLARDGEAIVAVIQDDGAGIDPQALRDRAIARGLLAPDGAMPDDTAALRLIFEPGFSTADRITDLSGRGVGMDAVQAAVTRLRGTIQLDSRPGAGTSFRLRLPAHALTTRLLVVHAGGERFAIPFDQVTETVRIARDAIRSLGSGEACVLRGRTVPVLDLARLLALDPDEQAMPRLVITQLEGRPVALRVQDVAHSIDTVLRPPRGMLARTPGVMGSVLLGDGSVLLVLDLAELLA